MSATSKGWLIIVGLVVCALCAVYAYFQHIHHFQNVQMDVYQVLRVYSRYVCDHGGSLPTCFDDLVGTAYLTRCEDSAGTYYLEPPEMIDIYLPACPQRPIRHVSEIGILYGGTLADYELRKGHVCRKDDGRKVLFVFHKSREVNAGDVQWNASIYQQCVESVGQVDHSPR